MIGTIKGKILGGFFSSTMWFGFLLMMANWLNNNTNMITAMFPSEYSELVLYGVGLLVWLFRWITGVPVEDKLPSAPKGETKSEKALREAFEKDEADMF